MDNLFTKVDDFETVLWLETAAFSVAISLMFWLVVKAF